MLIKNFFLSFFLILFISCDSFLSKKEQVVIDEIPIDFKTIDAYPLLPECKNITDRVLQKKCFYEQLSNKIQVHLANDLLESNDKIQGNILIKLQISSKGKASVTTVFMSEEIKNTIPKLDSLIRINITQLPLFLPAIKSGIPVTSEYTIPISIHTN